MRKFYEKVRSLEDGLLLGAPTLPNALMFAAILRQHPHLNVEFLSRAWGDVPLDTLMNRKVILFDLSNYAAKYWARPKQGFRSLARGLAQQMQKANARLVGILDEDLKGKWNKRTLKMFGTQIAKLLVPPRFIDWREDEVTQSGFRLGPRGLAYGVENAFFPDYAKQPEGWPHELLREAYIAMAGGYSKICESLNATMPKFGGLIWSERLMHLTRLLPGGMEAILQDETVKLWINAKDKVDQPEVSRVKPHNQYRIIEIWLHSTASSEREIIDSLDPRLNAYFESFPKALFLVLLFKYKVIKEVDYQEEKEFLVVAQKSTDTKVRLPLWDPLNENEKISISEDQIGAMINTRLLRSGSSYNPRTIYVTSTYAESISEIIEVASKVIQASEQ